MVAVAVAAILDRVNRRHPWSHNRRFDRFVLRRARRLRPRALALDVGCGTGELLVRLAPLFREVHGLEVDPATAVAARARIAGLATAAVHERDLAGWDGPPADLVTAVAVLHHLPLDEGLRRLRRCVSPGGRLVVVGLHRETRGDLPRSVLSAALNPLVGLVLHPRPATGTPRSMRAPVREPRETFAEVVAAARRQLPGARVRRRLFWRHTVTWTAPPVNPTGRRGRRG